VENDTTIEEHVKPVVDAIHETVVQEVRALSFAIDETIAQDVEMTEEIPEIIADAQLELEEISFREISIMSGVNNFSQILQERVMARPFMNVNSDFTFGQYRLNEFLPHFERLVDMELVALKPNLSRYDILSWSPPTTQAIWVKTMRRSGLVKWFLLLPWPDDYSFP